MTNYNYTVESNIKGTLGYLFFEKEMDSNYDYGFNSEVKQSQIYDARLCTSNHEKTS